MRKIFFLVIIALSFGFQNIAQTLTLETDNTGIRCHYMFIDITAADLPSNVASIQLYINTDGNAVQYIGQQPDKINAGVNQIGNNMIVVSWFDPFGTGANINGKLLTLILHYDGGSSVLDWQEAWCEIALSDLTVYPCNYVNGAVSEGSYTFNTYYVDGVSGSNLNNGLSWATAKKTIQAAADLALKPGEKVYIKPGTYNEKVTIKSDGGYAVLPKTGVILSDTNKITFPSGTNLSCVNLSLFPGQYYAYVYRSWNSNNGYYLVTEVNDAMDYVRVSGAAFIPETGVAGHKGKVMAAVGRPVIYKKDPAASESERVVIRGNGLGLVNDLFYVGKPSGDGQASADSCNFNIFEGIDITAGTNTSANKGLRIMCSAYNVFAKGKIYSLYALGAIINGNSSKAGKFNILQNNEIYNTPYQGVMLGNNASVSLSTNYSLFNHVIDNNIYLSGTGTQARFNNAVRVGYNNKSNVVEGNNIHDMNIYTTNNGACLIDSKADSTIVYNNIFRNIGRATTGTYAAIMINDSLKRVYAYNNIIFNDDTVANDVYAFRINGRKDTLSKVCYNTIYKIDRGFLLEDNSSGGATIDFSIQNNIISPATSNYIVSSGTTGRFNVSHNLTRASIAAPYGTGTGMIWGDPLFVDPEGASIYGLMLQPTSPAIGAGTPVSNVARDYLKIARHAGRPGMGAFEQAMSDLKWNGSVNTNWHNYLNWDLHVVPKSFINVTIPNVTNDPVISNGNATCKSLNLQPGAILNIQNSKTITVNN